MKKTRKTTEQIIRILRDSEGLNVEETCRRAAQDQCGDLPSMEGEVWWDGIKGGAAAA